MGSQGLGKLGIRRAKEPGATDPMLSVADDV